MLSQGAGGGYGDVLERTPNLVIKDLEENLVSPETARELYRVVYDEETFTVDDEATAALRREERQARLARSMSWDDFVVNHVTEQPPAGVPYYGSWNNSAELYAGPFGKGLPGELPPIILPDPLEVENARLRAQLADFKGQATPNRWEE